MFEVLCEQKDECSFAVLVTIAVLVEIGVLVILHALLSVILVHSSLKLEFSHHFMLKNI